MYKLTWKQFDIWTKFYSLPHKRHTATSDPGKRTRDVRGGCNDASLAVGTGHRHWMFIELHSDNNMGWLGMYDGCPLIAGLLRVGNSRLFSSISWWPWVSWRWRVGDILLLWCVHFGRKSSKFYFMPNEGLRRILCVIYLVSRLHRSWYLWHHILNLNVDDVISDFVSRQQYTFLACLSILLPRFRPRDVP